MRNVVKRIAKFFSDLFNRLRRAAGKYFGTQFNKTNECQRRLRQIVSGMHKGTNIFSEDGTAVVIPAVSSRP